jgi:hypothetical protein
MGLPAASMWHGGNTIISTRSRAGSERRAEPFFEDAGWQKRICLDGRLYRLDLLGERGP